MDNAINTNRNALSGIGLMYDIPLSDKQSSWGSQYGESIKNYIRDVARGKYLMSGLSRFSNALMSGISGDMTNDDFMELIQFGGVTKYINPPHRAFDINKLKGMIKTLKSGKDLPPVLIQGDQAYSGSHRLSAWKEMGMEPNYKEITDKDYIKIMKSMNLDPVYDTVNDFEPFLEKAMSLGLAKGAK